MNESNEIEISSSLANKDIKSSSETKSYEPTSSNLLNQNKESSKNNNLIIEEIIEESLFDIGKNIIYKEKYVLGIKENIYFFIGLIITLFCTYLLWVIFIYPYFVYNSSKIVIISLFILSTGFYFIGQYCHIMCFITEPGIIPRNYPPYQNGSMQNKIIYDKFTKRPIIMVQKHCNICGINRPNNCHHCSMCDNCVEEFDKHSSITSNCIGKRNRKYYFFFLLNILGFNLTILLTSVGQFFLSFAYYNIEMFAILSCISPCIFLIMTLLVLLGLSAYTNRNSKKMFYIGVVVDNVLYVVSFYYGKNSTNTFLPYFVSPVNLPLFSICAFGIFYMVLFFADEFSMVSIGFTNYEYKSLLAYKRAKNKEGAGDDAPCTVLKEIPRKKEIPKFDIINAIRNIRAFISRSIPKSILYEEINNLTYEE